MEKKNNKKKLFAIIGGSVLAFVLTIALSVSITLAYFGDTKTATANVTMGAAVTLGETKFATATMTGVVPTQKVDLAATATLADTSTESVLFAVVTSTASKSAVDVNLTEAPAGWVEVGTVTISTKDYTLYGFGTSSAAKLINVSGTDGGKLTSATFDASFIVDEDLTDDGEDSVAGATLTVNVQFIRVQQVYDSTGETPQTTLAAHVEAACEVGGLTLKA